MKLKWRTRSDNLSQHNALKYRWDNLPLHIKTRGQLIGRRFTGCEGTHGVFPKCDFSCKPCYHSSDANKVRIDGDHTILNINDQMKYLNSQRGFGEHAQLIGGEVSLLDPKDHADSLLAMREHGRMPMSFTHGDFSYEYLKTLAIDENNKPRFDKVSFAVHIDKTMLGRTGFEKPETEHELDVVRENFVAMFKRLKKEFRVENALAHNMTVTPNNIDEVADVVKNNKHLGYTMFSFQPAAYMGNESRWKEGYRDFSNDQVWKEIEKGIGATLPYHAFEFGDTRCNRESWGLLVGDKFISYFDESNKKDMAARDAFLKAYEGNFILMPRIQIAFKTVGILIRNISSIPVAISWLRRFIKRAGGLKEFRKGVKPLIFVMHSFMDAKNVKIAWENIQSGKMSTDTDIIETQERLNACVYAMAHPQTGELIPACVQHGILDIDENKVLAGELPLIQITHKTKV